MSRPLSALLLILSVASGSCMCGDPITPPPPPPPITPDAGTDVPTERCDYPLDDFLELSGTGASVMQLTSEDQAIGGPTAQARAGDWLLQNDKIRIVVQGVSRAIGPQPFGGTLLDADLVRNGPGRDQLGEIGLITNFGRTYDPQLFEVLADGSAGGPAILAISGPDIENDYLSLRNQLKGMLGALPVTDPYVPLPLKITQYFVLPPGEQRIHVLTSFCNVGSQEVLLAVGDLADPGDKLEFFNGQACTKGFGSASNGLCQGLDGVSWYGLLGDGVAYGFAPYRPGAPSVPETENALLVVSGVTGVIHGAPGIQGLLNWFDHDATSRRGELKIAPGAMRATARDFVVGRDLGEVASIIHRTRARATGAAQGTISGRVLSGGAPLPDARVSVRDEGSSTLATVFTTDADGRFTGTLGAKSFAVSAWADGRVPSAEQTVTLSSGGSQTVDFELPLPRTLTVNVTEVGAGAIPAKVTVLCATGICPAPDAELNRYTSTEHDPLLAGVQKIALVPPSGSVSFYLPPGQYNLVVSRGPEYSLWPYDFPTAGGRPVDLRGADAEVNAVLARVIDTTGWMSADFHVHAVGSPDSNVDNATRVKGFAAEGVDILVSTDHDYVTDFTPWLLEAGAQNVLSTVVGQEVSTLDYGHYNLFPMTRSDVDVTNGALDWAGGREPTLRVSQIFSEARRRGIGTIHFNHPRGFLGGFTHTRIDTDTFATHADPAEFRMAPDPFATPDNSRIISTDFNALEILNVADDEFVLEELYPRFNDWFVLLSRGYKIAVTGVSDTHRKHSKTGGYYRTYVDMLGADTPAGFDPFVMSNQLNSLAAVATSAPFVNMRAVRVGSGGAETSLPAKLGETLAFSNDAVKVTLDIQVPEHLDVTKIELYMHKPQDDARCPIPADHPNATTTRVACNGAVTRNWPASGITARRDIVLTPGDLENVVTDDGVTYRRYRLSETFQLPAPTQDNWLVAFVYGEKSLFPLVFLEPKPDKPNPRTFPFAVTNPIFIDADGGGYNHPPFDPDAIGGMAPAPRPAPPSLPLNRSPKKEEFLKAWSERFHAH